MSEDSMRTTVRWARLAVMVGIALATLVYRAGWKDVGGAIAGGSKVAGGGTAKGCVTVTDLSANTAGGYRAMMMGAKESAEKFGGVATEFRGHVYNGCDKPASSVRVQIGFKDPRGKKRSHTVSVGQVKPYEQKEFTLPLMGAHSDPVVEGVR